MIQEPFASGNSPFHRFDPRFKIVTAVAYSFLVALSSQFPTLLVSILVSSMLVGLARLNFKQVAWRMIVVNGMIFFFWVVLPLTVKGDVLFGVGPITVSRPGVVLAARLTLKSNAILLALMALIATSSVTTLGHALNGLHVPDKMIYLLLLTYRYLFVLEQEYQRLITAAKVRCFRPKNDLHTYRTYAYLVGMLLVRASLRGERVHQAMLCRGFKGKFNSLHEFSTSRWDWIRLAFITIIIIGLGVLEWGRIV
ncbi:MAG: cobalt ECF transporter T component CbiQ [Proteobacteria bacterium]|nr:cobalt ECF transporter T component CbiQ [Pseudomonadota bacterium]